MVRLPDPVTLELAYRKPFDLAAALDFLGRRAIPHVEQVGPEGYTRVLRAPGGPAAITLSTVDDALTCRIRLTDERDLATVVTRVRHLLDLDADPSTVDECLARDPVLAPLVARRPGLRSPGAVDGFEMAVRAVVGQQISVSGARTILGRIAAEHGTRAFDGQELVLFPGAAEFAGINPETLPMPKARGRTLIAVAQACATGTLTLAPDADREREYAALLALPGIGPWTAGYLRMRALGDPDVLLAGDLGVRKSAATLGVDLDDGRPDWAPWRSYATHHLWAAAHTL